MIISPERGTTEPSIAAAEITANPCYFCTNLIMYTVANPDPNPRGGGQLPNPNECIEGRDANP